MFIYRLARVLIREWCVCLVECIGFDLGQSSLFYYLVTATLRFLVIFELIDAALCCSWDPNNVYLYDYAASMTTGSTTANIVSLQGKLSVRVISVRFLIFQVLMAILKGFSLIHVSSLMT